MFRYLILVFLFSFCNLNSQTLSTHDSILITSVMDKQKQAWNNFDIDEFMKGYLNFENLVFSGKNGPVYGWDNIKERYLRAYSRKDEMGEVSFKIDNIFMIDYNSAILIGRFFLKRIVGDLSGHFTLVFKKVNNKWFIISDHTS